MLKDRDVRIFILIVEILVFITFVLRMQYIHYDDLTVTPLFFIRANNYFMPVAILGMILLAMISAIFNYRFSFILSILMLYFIVLYVQYSIFYFPIYNDQLGFALEAYSGFINGHVVPYQGEPATLGHAYFTTVIGRILGLDLFNSVKFVKAYFVFASYLVFLTVALSVFRKINKISDRFLALSITLFFPAFILEPLAYSRGYFGIVISLYLFLALFILLRRPSIASLATALVSYLAMSFSYPIQPSLVVFAMILTLILYKFIPLFSKSQIESLHIYFTYATPAFFILWLAVQAFFGLASWSVLHEVISKALQMRFFTSAESVERGALSYVGDAAIYTQTRISMILYGWLLSLLTFIILFYKIKKARRASTLDIFSASIVATLGGLGALYAALYHDPGLRFYRITVGILPIILAYMYSSISRDHAPLINNLIGKAFKALIIFGVILFLILSPITKWGWTFVAYPTERDVALSEFIVSGYGGSSSCSIYAPGSHQLLWFYFESNVMGRGNLEPRVDGGDVNFNVTKAMHACHTATYYRLAIYPRWQGENVDILVDEIAVFARSNNLLYNDGDFRLFIKLSA